MVSSLPILDPKKIRGHFTSTIYQRGKKYHQRGEVLNLTLRDYSLQAHVQGSDYEPYRVQVELESDDFLHASCNCPYDQGGYCKHIAAVLLEYIHEPQAVQHEVGLEQLLKPLKKKELREALEYLWHSHPEIQDSLSLHLEKSALKAAQESIAVGSKANDDAMPVTVDVARYARMMRSAVKQAPSDWDGYPEYDEACSLLDEVSSFFEQGDYTNALAISTVFFETFIASAHQRDAHMGMDGIHFSDENLIDLLDMNLAHAILGSTLSQHECELLFNNVLAWRKQMDNDWASVTLPYSGAALLHHLRNYLQVDNDKALQKMTQQCSPLKDYELSRFLHMQLRVLKHRGTLAEQLEFAKEAGLNSAYLNLLLESGQYDEALQAYSHMVDRDEDRLAFIEAIQDIHPEDALHLLAEQLAHYLSEKTPFVDTDEGTQNRYMGTYSTRFAIAEIAKKLAKNRQEYAHVLYHAYLFTFPYQPNLQDYKKLSKLSGEAWQDLRKDILEFIQKPSTDTTVQEEAVAILLHEQMHEEAMRYVSEQYISDAPIQHVMQVVKTDYPRWVIGIATARASQMIDVRNNEAYERAVVWLQIIKETYHLHDEDAAWDIYIGDVVAQHKRKRNFMRALAEIHTI